VPSRCIRTNNPKRFALSVGDNLPYNRILVCQSITAARLGLSFGHVGTLRTDGYVGMTSSKVFMGILSFSIHRARECGGLAVMPFVNFGIGDDQILVWSGRM